MDNEIDIEINSDIVLERPTRSNVKAFRRKRKDFEGEVSDTFTSAFWVIRCSDSILASSASFQARVR